MNMIKQWLAKLLNQKSVPPRKVWLEMHDGRLVQAQAKQTDSGWVARWIANDDQWSLLLPDGKTSGTSLVRAWKPHTGWNGEN